MLTEPWLVKVKFTHSYIYNTFIHTNKGATSGLIVTTEMLDQWLTSPIHGEGLIKVNSNLGPEDCVFLGA